MIIIMFSVCTNINNFANSGLSEPKFFGILRSVSVCTQDKKVAELVPVFEVTF
jgi:hypothetical protein